MDDISWPTPVQYHRYATGRESFKHHAAAALANSRKHNHIGGSQPRKNFGIRNPPGERNGLFDLKRFYELFKGFSLRSIAYEGEVSQLVSQKGAAARNPI